MYDEVTRIAQSCLLLQDSLFATPLRLLNNKAQIQTLPRTSLNEKGLDRAVA